ncbi:MAG: Bug family tripartite tricarboxylate transporter substrate binding protein [Beijerinckiaceae bacterium]
MHASRFAAPVFAGLAFIAPPALAEDSAGFFKGKTVTIIAGSSAGGGLDTYARLVGRHIGSFLPGKPNVVVQNMPGAGSLVAARYVFTKSPKDGTQMGIVLPGALFYNLLKKDIRPAYDPTKLNYVGNANSETVVCVVRKDAPVKEFKDVFEKELIVGGTGPGSTMVDYPNVAKAILGAKIKLIPGYKGSRQVSLAVAKGELHGACGLAWSSAKQQYAGVETGAGDFKVLVMEDTKVHPQLKGKAALAIDFAKTREQKDALTLMYAQGIITRPFILPPGVPADRVAVIRKAFMDAMQSKELQAEAEKQKTEAVATDGAFVQKLVDELHQAPPATIAKLRAALGGK